MTDVSKFDDVIDSRDVIARIAELESERDDWETDHDGDDERNDWAEENSDEAEELATLQAFEREAEGYAPDWHDGATLIHDDYFEKYAQQLAEDIGAVNESATWPNTCIDWAQAARELQMDYSAVDFDGQTYWVR